MSKSQFVFGDVVNHVNDINTKLYVITTADTHPTEKITGNWVKCRILTKNELRSDWFLESELKHIKQRPPTKISH